MDLARHPAVDLDRECFSDEDNLDDQGVHRVSLFSVSTLSPQELGRSIAGMDVAPGSVLEGEAVLPVLAFHSSSFKELPSLRIDGGTGRTRIGRQRRWIDGMDEKETKRREEDDLVWNLLS